nr:MAG TPA: hypothetical protein [Bacteriophage sp.]
MVKFKALVLSNHLSTSNVFQFTLLTNISSFFTVFQFSSNFTAVNIQFQT